MEQWNNKQLNRGSKSVTNNKKDDNWWRSGFVYSCVLASSKGLD